MYSMWSCEPKTAKAHDITLGLHACMQSHMRTQTCTIYAYKQENNTRQPARMLLPDLSDNWLPVQVRAYAAHQYHRSSKIRPASISRRFLNGNIIHCFTSWLAWKCCVWVAGVLTFSCTYVCMLWISKCDCRHVKIAYIHSSTSPRCENSWPIGTLRNSRPELLLYTQAV